MCVQGRNTARQEHFYISPNIIWLLPNLGLKLNTSWLPQKDKMWIDWYTYLPLDEHLIFMKWSCVKLTSYSVGIVRYLLWFWCYSTWLTHLALLRQHLLSHILTNWGNFGKWASVAWVSLSKHETWQHCCDQISLRDHVWKEYNTLRGNRNKTGCIFERSKSRSHAHPHKQFLYQFDG